MRSPEKSICMKIAPVRRMKVLSFFLYLWTFLFVICAQTRGPGVSGGGGGNLRVMPLSKDDGGKDSIRVASMSVRERISRLRDAHGTRPCPGNSNLLLPNLGSDLGPYFNLLLPVSSRETGSSFVPLQPEMDSKICNSPNYYDAYGAFILALREIESRRPWQGIARTLIRRTRDLGGKIQILLSSEAQSFLGVGELIEEPAWFNSATGMIHWGKTQDCSGFGCLIDSRGQGGLLVHEVTHMFLSRALGDRHPREGLFHDARHVRESGVYRNKAILSMRSKTSVSSAFIEGLASAFEFDGSFNRTHPFLDANIIQMVDGCYRSNSTEYAVMFRQVPFSAPRDSEVYVASSLMKMFSTWFTDVDMYPTATGPRGLGLGPTILSAHSGRMTAMLEAIIRYRPTSVLALAQALDRQMNSDVGRRWLREYFFIDSVTGQRIGSEFSTLSTSDSGLSICTKNPQALELNLSSTLRREQLENVQNATEMYYQRVSAEQLKNDIRNLRSSIVVELGHARSRLKRLGPVIEYALQFAQDRHRCLNTSSHNQPRLLEVYDRLSQSGRTQFLEDIRSILACADEKGRVDITKELADLRHMESQMDRIAGALVTSERSLADQVKLWLQLKPQLLGKRKWIEKWLVVFEAESKI